MTGTPKFVNLPPVLHSLLTSLFIKDQNLMIYSEHKLKEIFMIFLRKKNKDLDAIEINIASKELHTYS